MLKSKRVLRWILGLAVASAAPALVPSSAHAGYAYGYQHWQIRQDQLRSELDVADYQLRRALSDADAAGDTRAAAERRVAELSARLAADDRDRDAAMRQIPQIEADLARMNADRQQMQTERGTIEAAARPVLDAYAAAVGGRNKAEAEATAAFEAGPSMRNALDRQAAAQRDLSVAEQSCIEALIKTPEYGRAEFEVRSAESILQALRSERPAGDPTLAGVSQQVIEAQGKLEAIKRAALEADPRVRLCRNEANLSERVVMILRQEFAKSLPADPAVAAAIAEVQRLQPQYDRASADLKVVDDRLTQVDNAIAQATQARDRAAADIARIDADRRAITDDLAIAQADAADAAARQQGAQAAADDISRSRDSLWYELQSLQLARPRPIFVPVCPPTPVFCPPAPVCPPEPIFVAPPRVVCPPSVVVSVSWGSGGWYGDRWHGGHGHSHHWRDSRWRDGHWHRDVADGRRWRDRDDDHDRRDHRHEGDRDRRDLPGGPGRDDRDRRPVVPPTGERNRAIIVKDDRAASPGQRPRMADVRTTPVGLPTPPSLGPVSKSDQPGPTVGPRSADRNKAERAVAESRTRGAGVPSKEAAQAPISRPPEIKRQPAISREPANARPGGLAGKPPEIQLGRPRNEPAKSGVSREDVARDEAGSREPVAAQRPPLPGQQKPEAAVSDRPKPFVGPTNDPGRRVAPTPEPNRPEIGRADAGSSNPPRPGGVNRKPQEDDAVAAAARSAQQRQQQQAAKELAEREKSEREKAGREAAARAEADRERQSANARKQADEAREMARRQNEENDRQAKAMDLQKRAAEDARREAAARAQQEAEQARAAEQAKMAERQRQKQQEAMAEQQQRAAEAARRQAEADARRQEMESRRQAEAEANARRQAEAEARRQAEAESRRQAEAESRRQNEARRQAEEAARRQSESQQENNRRSQDDGPRRGQRVSIPQPQPRAFVPSAAPTVRSAPAPRQEPVVRQAPSARPSPQRSAAPARSQEDGRDNRSPNARRGQR